MLLARVRAVHRRLVLAARLLSHPGRACGRARSSPLPAPAPAPAPAVLAHTASMLSGSQYCDRAGLASSNSRAIAAVRVALRVFPASQRHTGERAAVGTAKLSLFFFWPAQDARWQVVWFRSGESAEKNDACAREQLGAHVLHAHAHT